jgi:DNA mismatch endonuclease (patch repair protein)
MERQARRDTKPEFALRRAVWQRGFRYRVDVAPIPGLRRRADMVFSRARVAVYVDGCFWHSCPEHATVPKANRDWWVAKLGANVERDRDTDRRLKEAQWTVVRVWEHEDPEEAAARVASYVVEAETDRGRARVRSRKRIGPGRGGR